MAEVKNTETVKISENILNSSKPEGEQYELARNTIAKWPDWKKEIFNRLIRITT